MLDRRHIPFVTTCCANCFILLVMVVDLLLCLTYKSNFIIGMHREEKHGRLRVHYYPWFQASIGGLEGVSLVAQMVKNLPATGETPVQSLGREDPPGEGNGYPL